ncbi:MAG: hypothetical protein WBE26_11930 [Phycisphaerae bacterium]
MKVAVLSESRADETALGILVGGMLKVDPEPATPRPLRARGWPSILDTVGTVLRHLHYQTCADALVVVTDSDNSLVHERSHESPDCEENDCRLCEMRKRVKQVLANLSPVHGRQTLRTAIGLACPCIEAWYLCGKAGQITEAAWSRKLESCSNLRVERLKLKRLVYGTERPSLELECKHAEEEARRLVTCLPLLEKHFPNGFGALAQDVRSWTSTPMSDPPHTSPG